MDKNITQMEKERIKALGDLLVAECKLLNPSIESIQNYIAEGAKITHKNSQALYAAAKSLKFELIDFLIDNGALESDASTNYIAAMCDYKGFKETDEPEYFRLLDRVAARRGGGIELFAPYINSNAVNGRVDKMQDLKDKYGFSDPQIVNTVFIRIIFEVIQCGYENVLAYINSYRNWTDQAAFDLAVSTNEWIACEYFIGNTLYRTPSDIAVGQALYEGSFEVLTILDKIGYDFSNKALFLEKACRAAISGNLKSLEFLLARGYSVNGKYKGKTVFEHAYIDNNAPLLSWLNLKANA